jgi:hypothetical protein
MTSTFARVLVCTTFTTFVGFGVIGCTSHSSASQAAMSSSSSMNTAPAQPAAVNVPGVQRTQNAAGGLRAVSDELSTTRQAIGDTLQALQTISTANGDLLEPFQRFISLREQLEQDDQRIGQRAEEMRSRARDYVTNWEVEVYGVEDKALREQAEQRRNRVRENYGRISDTTRALREAFDPFRRDLKDIETFLANDLTPAGVRAATPAIQRATTGGQEVQHRIDAVIAELQRVAGAMTPAMSQPSTGTSEVLAPGYTAPTTAEPNK